MGKLDDVWIAALVTAAEQHGALSVGQLRARGLDASAQRTAVRSGQLSMIEPTVAVVGGSPDTWHRCLHVGLLALGPAAWVSHEAAAALHGLDRSPHEPLEFTVRRTRRRACSNAMAPNILELVASLGVLSTPGATSPVDLAS